MEVEGDGIVSNDLIKKLRIRTNIRLRRKKK